MSRWEGAIDFEKYYGEKKYKRIQQNLEKKTFSKIEKRKLLIEIMSYIKEKEYKLYHDFMDDISINKKDWFNFLTYDKKANKIILEYIKFIAIKPYR